METQTNDEISLQDVVVRSIKTLRRHLVLFLTGSVLGMIVALGLYSILPNVYEGKMIIMSDLLISHSFRIIGDIETRNLPEFAQLTNMTEEESGKIRKLKIANIQKTVFVEKEKDMFQITAEVLDTAVLPKLQTGIVYFLRNNEYLQIKLKQRRDLDSAMVKKIDGEIKSLEDLKVQFFQGKAQRSASSDWMVDPAAINTAIVELTEDKITFQNDMELADSVQLIQGFAVDKTRVAQRLLLHIIAGLLVGFMSAFFILAAKRISELTKS